MKNKFYFHELQNSFIGKIQLLDNNIELEIKTEELEVDWEEIEKFVLSLEDEYLSKILDISSQLLLEFIKLVPFGVEEPFSTYKFRLEGIVYYGKVENRIFSEMVDGFELLFKLYRTSFVECQDLYGNYIIRVDNRLITGVRREQI